ncbi:hypothetical protein TcasGA2_TC031744 [Tribolium castaneum]|uniref:Uncharacterized protein n=1 Tax=Tribolium castaneum TaxID=7070 RepID=A0A139W9N1_TRICA|nr:PREDICTED: uncharacterized protein LOC103315099 [Tribolium castaneum]KYB24619.1 hypothetical protein TcasGA2_TC031744 [Tribolium castaneum]|eukprot:XP_008201163.1 PREDICTED: uncharacterized protein LOC103315099 [Tribolium castaneum]
MNTLIFSTALIALSSVVLIDNALSLSCISSACDTIDCRPITECGPGEIKAKGGHCLCCDFCKKIIGEGETCAKNVPMSNQLSDSVVCGEGLLCHEGKCQKSQEVLKATT